MESKFNIGDYIIYRPLVGGYMDENSFKPGRVQKVIDVYNSEMLGERLKTEFLDNGEKFEFSIGSIYYDDCIKIDIKDIQVGDIITNIGYYRDQSVDKFMRVISISDGSVGVKGLDNNYYDQFNKRSLYYENNCIVVFRKPDNITKYDMRKLVVGDIIIYDGFTYYDERGREQEVISIDDDGGIYTKFLDNDDAYNKFGDTCRYVRDCKFVRAIINYDNGVPILWEDEI